MLSIAVLARTERFLNNTINDILEKATGEIEVIPVLDGYGDKPNDLRGFEGAPYEPIEDPRVKYIVIPNNGRLQKRQGINAAMSIARGENVAWVDGHCCFDKGFDEKLIADLTDEMIMVPRRHRLIVETWSGTSWDKPPIDYEYFMWQFLKKGRIAAYKWNEKTINNEDKMIDDVMTIQGSFVIMKKTWYDKCGFMRLEGYTGWGQEGEELCLRTMQMGGRAVVNKNTWYAHLHKGPIWGRMYKWTSKDIYPSYDYSFNYWVRENREFFISVCERFMPIPNFPPDWKEKICKF